MLDGKSVSWVYERIMCSAVSECMNCARICFARRGMIAVSQRVHHMPYKSWRCLRFSSSSILLTAIRVWQAQKQSWLELLWFFFPEIFCIVIECSTMKCKGFTRNVLIGNLFILCVFESILCQRKVPENQVFNSRQWSIGPSARCKWWRKQSQFKQELICFP